MNAVVVCEHIHATHPDQKPFILKIEVGTPFPYDDKREEWICPLNIPALDRADVNVHGGSAFQALNLALRLSYRSLKDFREQGGRLSYAADNADDYDLESTFGTNL